MHRLGPNLCLLGISVLVLSEVHLLFGGILATKLLVASQTQRSDTKINAPRREPIEVGGNVAENIYRHIVYPVYPEQAKQEHLEGEVSLKLTVNEEGLVYDVVGAPGNNATLEESAISAVRKWRYRPTLLNGEPVPVLRNEAISFVWKDRDDVRVWLDESGLSCDMKQILEANGAIWINIAPQTPYRLIESLYRKLIQQGVQRVRWPRDYQIYQNQLFLSINMIDRGEANFNKSDIDRVSQIALASGKFGNESSPGLRYVLYFDKAHAFINLQRLEGPEIPEAEKVFQQLRPKNEQIFPYDTPVAISFYLPLKREYQ